MKAAPEFDWPRRETFLKLLAETGNISKCCKAVDVSSGVAYKHRKNDKEFGVLWDEAEDMAADAIEAEMWRRGVDGVDRPLVFQGEITPKKDADGKVMVDDKNMPIPQTIKEYSDVLLIQMAKAKRPEKFNERLQVEGVGGGNLVVEHIISLKRRTPEMGEEVLDDVTVIDNEVGTKDHAAPSLGDNKLLGGKPEAVEVGGTDEEGERPADDDNSPEARARRLGFGR